MVIWASAVYMELGGPPLALTTTTLCPLVAHTPLTLRSPHALHHASQEGQLRSPELMTAIPSRIAAHPSLPVLVGATNSGRLHVWR